MRRSHQDWQATLRRLGRAEQNIAKGREHIARQERRIASLKRRGKDTGEARAILGDFLRIQAMQEADRARLWRTLHTATDQRSPCDNLITVKDIQIIGALLCPRAGHAPAPIACPTCWRGGQEGCLISNMMEI
jgi:hypothetical protein